MGKQKSLPIVKVTTEQDLITQLTELSKTVAIKWLKGKNINTFNIVMASMVVIEQYSSQVGLLNSTDKLNAAIKLLPFLIQLLVQAGAISKDDGDHYLQLYNDNQELIQNFINVAIDIVNNPNILIIKDYIDDKVTGCFSRCKKSSTKE
jgi:hypothetical protein